MKNRHTSSRGALLAATALSLSALAPQAHAHDTLMETVPKDGASVAEAPEVLELTFSDALTPAGHRMSLADAEGKVVAEGEPTLDGPKATFDLPEDLGGGEYALTWRVTSSDGHPISGRTTFTVEGGEGTGKGPAEPDPQPEQDPADAPEAAAPAEAAPAASSEESSGLSGGMLLGLGAVGALVIGAGLFLLRS